MSAEQERAVRQRRVDELNRRMSPDEHRALRRAGAGRGAPPLDTPEATLRVAASPRADRAPGHLPARPFPQARHPEPGRRARPVRAPEAADSTNRPRLDEGQLATVVLHAEEPHRAGVALLAFTGARLSEVLALRWQDVDFVELDLRVAGQWTRAKRHGSPARIKARKAGRDPYTTTILPALEAELTRRLRVSSPPAAVRPTTSSARCRARRTAASAQPEPGRDRRRRGGRGRLRHAAGPPSLVRDDRRATDPRPGRGCIHDRALARDVGPAYVGRGGPEHRADARARLLEADSAPSTKQGATRTSLSPSRSYRLRRSPLYGFVATGFSEFIKNWPRVAR